MTNLKEGQKVKENRQGSTILTVLTQRGTSVWFYEMRGTIHITHLIEAV